MSVTSLVLKGTKGEVVTEVENNDEDVFKVYPNPVAAKGEFAIEIRGSGKAILCLKDANGREIKKIFERVLTEEYRDTISVGNIPKGIYFLQLSLNGRIINRKLLTL